MTRVLVGLQMFQCNRSPGQMDFSLPALSAVCTLLYCTALLLVFGPVAAMMQMAETWGSV